MIMQVAWREDMVLFKPLDFKLVRFYGRISYSFYLLHPLGMLFAYRAINPLALHAWGMPLTLAIIFDTLTAILFTTPAAWLTWRFIEAPAISLGRTLGKKQPKLQVVS
jgi:peptidoglycan/LPS O-acetylase OafA/YrhL